MPARTGYYKRKRKANAARKTWLAKRKMRSTQRGYLRTSGYYKWQKRGEYKFLDTTTNQFTVSQAGVVVDPTLVEIPQGVTQSSRVGRKCTIKKISMRGYTTIVPTDSANETADRVRIIVFVDHQANGAAAGVTDILETADVDSFRNLSNVNRFSVLLDRTYSNNSIVAFTNGAGDDIGRHILNFSFNKTLNMPVEYDDSATTGAIGTIRSNNIGVLVIGQEDQYSVMSYVTRVRFSDY